VPQRHGGGLNPQSHEAAADQTAGAGGNPFGVIHSHLLPNAKGRSALCGTDDVMRHAPCAEDSNLREETLLSCFGLSTLGS
jgi:hypothetical protein